MKEVLWLASWYPNRKEPFEGDFIQRHARALSIFRPVTLIHVTQYGEEIEPESDDVEIRCAGNLREIIAYFKFKKKGFRLFDKLRYNIKYLAVYKKILKNHIREHGFPEYVHVHVPMKAGKLALYLNKKHGIPFGLSEHSSAYFDFVPENYFAKKRYYRNAVKKIFREASFITTVSKKIGIQLKQIFKTDNLSIIPNVVDTKVFNFPECAPNKFRFIHASTMNYPKNVEGMLRALASLKTLRDDWECVMLGWDSPVLKQMSSDLELSEFITWKGVVSYSEVAFEMKRSSSLIMFSRYENLPCTIIEALCCGLPVVTSNVGGIPEVVNAKNGLLVEQGNEDQFVSALDLMITTYTSYDREGIAEDAQAKFNYNEIGKQFAALYDQHFEKRERK